jgi:hypothetical protein
LFFKVPEGEHFLLKALSRAFYESFRSRWGLRSMMCNNKKKHIIAL